MNPLTSFCFEPLLAIFNATDSCGYPENRLKYLINVHLAPICLTSRSEAILSGVQVFSANHDQMLPGNFIKRQVLDHLSAFHDGGIFTIRMLKNVMEAFKKLEMPNQTFAKLLAVFRKTALGLLNFDNGFNGKFIVELSFDSARTLIDFVITIIGSKRLFCDRNCKHTDFKCISFQLAVAIVRIFLASCDENGGNRLKIMTIKNGSDLSPKVIEGLIVKLGKSESLDAFETWIANRKLESGFKCLIFRESPKVFGNPVENENKKLLKDANCKFGTSFDSFKEAYCKSVAKVFQSHGVDIVFCQKLVDDELVLECARCKILLIDRLGDEECIYLETFLNTTGSIWPIESEWNKFDAKVGRIDKIGVFSPKMIHLSRGETQFQTLIVSSPIEDLLPDLKALCESALLSLKLTMTSKRHVLKGGGVWQVQLANAIFGDISDQLERLASQLHLPKYQITRAMSALCSALASVGVRLDRRLTHQIRVEIQNLSHQFFIAENEEEISSCNATYDCYLTFRSAFDTALCTALTLISTDQFIDEKFTRRNIENSKQLSH